MSIINEDVLLNTATSRIASLVHKHISRDINVEKSPMVNLEVVYKLHRTRQRDTPAEYHCYSARAAWTHALTQEFSNYDDAKAQEILDDILRHQPISERHNTVRSLIRQFLMYKGIKVNHQYMAPANPVWPGIDKRQFRVLAYGSVSQYLHELQRLVAPIGVNLHLSNYKGTDCRGNTPDWQHIIAYDAQFTDYVRNQHDTSTGTRTNANPRTDGRSPETHSGANAHQ